MFVIMIIIINSIIVIIIILNIVCGPTKCNLAILKINLSISWYCVCSSQSLHSVIWGSHSNGYKDTVLWDVALCSLVDRHKRFRGICCLHLQDIRVSYQKTVIQRLENSGSCCLFVLSLGPCPPFSVSLAIFPVACSSVCKLEAEGPSRKVFIYQTTWCLIPKGSKLQCFCSASGMWIFLIRSFESLAFISVPQRWVRISLQTL
jgi:hypothetical protein